MLGVGSRKHYLTTELVSAKAPGQSENKEWHNQCIKAKDRGVCILYCSVPIHMKKVSEKGLTLCQENFHRVLRSISFQIILCIMKDSF